MGERARQVGGASEDVAVQIGLGRHAERVRAW